VCYSISVRLNGTNEPRSANLVLALTRSMDYLSARVVSKAINQSMMGHEQRMQLPACYLGDFGMVLVLMGSLADTKCCFAIKGGDDDLQWYNIIEFVFDMPLL